MKKVIVLAVVLMMCFNGVAMSALTTEEETLVRELIAKQDVVKAVEIQKLEKQIDVIYTQMEAKIQIEEDKYTVERNKIRESYKDTIEAIEKDIETKREELKVLIAK